MNGELLNKCRNAETIFIYGAGAVADIFYIFLKQNQIQDKVKSFVVTKSDANLPDKFGIHTVTLSEVVDELKNALVIIAVQSFTQGEIESVLQENEVSGYDCVGTEELLNGFYDELYHAPIEENKILFQNQSGEGYGGNPKYIAEKLLEYDTDQKLDLVWSVFRHREGIPKRVRQVLYGSEEYYKELATAKVWVDNSRKPFSARKRKGQFYIQAWHGAAPIKRVEKDAEDVLPAYYIEGARNDSKMADVFLAGSEFYSRLYRKSFWYDGVILKFGLPRHDVFWNMAAIRRKICDFYKIEENYGIVLYAPTFRDYHDIECYDLDINRAAEALEKKFHRPFRMMVSRHPVNYQEYTFKKDADYIDVGDYDDFQELLAAADILITDYSGCMYDFSYTQRPVFLYQKDYGEYLRDRNFYIPMEKLPYIKAHSNDEMEQAIEGFDGERYASELKTFMGTMGNYDAGNASERVVQYLKENVISF
ncbi:MAG: hypothetical protein HFI44_06290 [Lachnospiraceae bacterium]|nr:hypothetical protein [Lachnospiraceae bacterium]